MKKYLALLLVLVIVSTFAAVAFAQTITLSVTVNPNSGTALNVTYTARVNPVSAEPQLVKFYTAKDLGGITPPFPITYIGSAYANNLGIATISFHQDPGKYLGGAVVNGIRSNIVRYGVQ